MTIPGPELQQRIRRIEHGLSQVGTLLVPVEISDGVKKAITLSNIDPDMALGRARKVLDFIVADLYKREFGRSPGTQPLENSVQQLAKAGKLPRTMVAYANSVRELGNVGIHGSGEAITEEDVVSSLENLMRLVAWYCEQVRPGGSEDKLESLVDEDRQAEKEKAERERVENEQREKRRLEQERIEKERAEKENAEKARLQEEQLAKERLEKERLENERVENERIARERAEKEELERRQLERQRAEKEQLERRQLERQQTEELLREKERLEQEEFDRKRAEEERRAKAEKERIERERLEKERLERIRLEQEHERKGRFRKWVVLALLCCVAAGALWWWLTASPSAKRKEFLKHKYNGIALLNTGQYPEASLELLAAYSMDHNDDYVYYCLGEAASHLNKWTNAIDYYRRSLRLKPDTSYAQIGLANALLQSGDVDGAIAEFKVITSTNYNPPLDPTTSAWVHENYSSALLRKGDFNGAVSQSAQAVEADPNWRSKLRDRIQVPPHPH